MSRKNSKNDLNLESRKRDDKNIKSKDRITTCKV